MKKILLFTIFTFCFGFSKAQLTITDSLTTTQITSLLEGTGISISGLTVNCPQRSIGQFSGTSEMAITQGLVLSTGHVDDIAGLNNSGSMGTGLNNPGDADLDVLAVNTTFDACVLEFDCVPVGDTLLFNFSFGSEEYLEFVNAGVNDVFAILVSGPGIIGTINAAALPGGTPVTIDNVNALVNPSYYYDNESPAGVYVAFDGFTTNLTAFAEVFPDSTYHFKVAIADAGDGVWDSGVFLEAFSFRSVAAVETGIDEKSASALSVYPNPGNGNFMINDKKNALQGAELKVINTLGQQVFSERIVSAQTQIDITAQPSGIYYATVTTADGILKTKLLKK